MLNTSPSRILVILIVVALIASVVGTVTILGASIQPADFVQIWLPFFLLALSLPIAVIGLILVVLGLGWTLINAFGLLGQIKPSSGTFDWKLGFNPFNAIFFPQHLTDRGLIARQRILRGVLIFLFGFLLAAPAIMVTEFFP